MAQYLASTPHPNFFDIRRGYGTRISLGLCSCFLCVHSRSPLGQAIPTDQYLSGLILFLFAGSFGKCISGSDTPAVWDRSRTSGLELQSLRGYEVDKLFALFSLPTLFYCFVFPTLWWTWTY